MADRDETAASSSELFHYFVAQQQFTAMIYMGKIAHPESGKNERNLDAARFVIDILGMLEEKTRGNLSEDENRYLAHVLTNLRLNFVDEAGRPDEGAAESSPDRASEGEKDASAASATKPAGSESPPGTTPTEPPPGEPDAKG
ncbi:MAG: DUF1844 domain-containing protein [Candidatus Eisenbacteria bacterium]|nr:DUF1844 domain-containing protein [Candidatus Eisenbacteria bacterium]